MRKMNISKNNQGFTLIELLIVIIILSILATAAFVYLNPTQWTARGNDTKRLADIKNLHDTVIREVAQGNISLSATPVESNTLLTENPNANKSEVGTDLAGLGFVKFTATNENYKFGGFPILPVDPKNGTTISYDYKTADGTLARVQAVAKYKFCVSLNGFEFNTILEADTDKMANDGGSDPKVYEVGTDTNACTSAF